MRKLVLALTAAALTTVAACSSTVDSSQGGYGQPACSGKNAIKPDGAPFCYLRPPGTTKPDKLSFAAHKFISGVVVKGDNGIVVGLTLKSDAYNGLTDDELLQQVTKEYEAAGPGETTIDTDSGTVRKVPAGRMIAYNGTDGDTHVQTQVVFAEDEIIQVNCNWKDADQKSAVTDACGSVLSTLQLVK